MLSLCPTNPPCSWHIPAVVHTVDGISGYDALLSSEFDLRKATVYMENNLILEILA